MREKSQITYLEEAFKRLVLELKEKNCLRQDFEFLTQTEQMDRLEKFVDEFNRDPE